MLAAEQGVDVIPVWNKSYREHSIVGSIPASARAAAEAAVLELGWSRPYFVDADHINLRSVDGFLEACDFYTIDVADAIGQPAKSEDIGAFVARHPELGAAGRIAARYLFAVQEAARIYRYIAGRKNAFIAEVSMDETDCPQTPDELLVILAALADENVPLQTIAPKFTGRFNKGVDYVGDAAQFEREFAADIDVIAHAVKTYGLPPTLKLSVHSGSDKFSIYGPIRRALAASGAGVHLKTAGTTWLEELIGLAEAGGEALDAAKEVYASAYARREELCAPYAAVIDIDAARLPDPAEVSRWSREQYAAALRHDPRCPQFNPALRQLLHVGYKVAAKMGDRYLRLLEQHEDTIGINVTANLYQRHIRPVFISAS
jgi:hypothetical protein